MREKSSRRAEIIKTAFALTGEFSVWTLSEVAGRMGVSKPALYRHFRNKEEIEAVMEEDFRNGLLSVIERGENTPQGFRDGLRSFFRKNAGYLEFFVSRIFTRDSFEEELFSFLVAESSRVAAFNRMMGTAPSERKDAVAAEILKTIVSVILASVKEKGIEPLQEALLGILEGGLKGLEIPDSARFEELNRDAVLEASELGPENRLFGAIAASIREFGVPGTTTERIAEKMGITKSSLYFYYPNKEGMLFELVKSETENIKRLCSLRVARGKTLAEQLYSLMAVQANYLLIKPDILPVFNWIRFESIREKHRNHPHDHDDAEIAGEFRASELFPEDTEDSRRRMQGILKWASILATSAVLQGVRQGETPDRIRNNVRLVFKSMVAGQKDITE